jgi:hypothetical protein
MSSKAKSILTTINVLPNVYMQSKHKVRPKDFPSIKDIYRSRILGILVFAAFDSDIRNKSALSRSFVKGTCGEIHTLYLIVSFL